MLALFDSHLEPIPNEKYSVPARHDLRFSGVVPIQSRVQTHPLDTAATPPWSQPEVISNDGGWELLRVDSVDSES